MAFNEKEIWTLADNLWRVAGSPYPLKNASATYQDQYRRIARFLSESGCLEKCEKDKTEILGFIRRHNAACNKLYGEKL